MLFVGREVMEGVRCCLCLNGGIVGLVGCVCWWFMWRAWRNGSAFDSRSKGWVFESPCPHLFLVSFCL